MPLTTQAEAFLQMIADAGLPPVEQCSAQQNRSYMSAPAQPLEAVARVENREIPGPASEISLRVYRPTGAELDAGGKLPGIVFYHGGGWVVGSIDSHDGLCRMLANRCGAVVVSVEYRLAPEHKFPAAADDAFAAACWVAQNAAELGIHHDRLAVAGDSAGGNLAAVVSLMARDRGFPALACQMLLYPVTDHDFTRSSYVEHAQGRFLTRAAMIWFFEQYLESPADVTNPYVSPLHAADLSRLPPAIVLSAEFDPLCDEAIAYGNRLHAEGTPVTMLHAPGLLHGFLRRPDFFPQADAMLLQLAQAFRSQIFASLKPV